jgi:hypothetical protein
MLDDVQRRRVLVEPAREHATPALVRTLDVELHESARQLLTLPGRGRLARAQAHNRVIHSNGLARLQCQVANDAVALVEQAENGDAVGHRSDAGLLARARARRRQPRTIGLLRLVAAAATREEQQQCRAGNGKCSQSGVHGW